VARVFFTVAASLTMGLVWQICRFPDPTLLGQTSFAGGTSVVIGLWLLMWHRTRIPPPSIPEMSHQELRRATRLLAEELRAFQSRMDAGTTGLLLRRMSHPSHLSEEEKSRRFWDDSRDYERARSSFDRQFGPLRARAITVRDELLHRLRIPRPSQDASAELEQTSKMVLHDGMLAGPHPLNQVAAYLVSRPGNCFT
jgi:hypothetical protein